jgi:hypothetical protein
MPLSPGSQLNQDADFLLLCILTRQRLKMEINEFSKCPYSLSFFLLPQALGTFILIKKFCEEKNCWNHSFGNNFFRRRN